MKKSCTKVFQRCDLHEKFPRIKTTCKPRAFMQFGPKVSTCLYHQDYSDDYQYKKSIKAMKQLRCKASKLCTKEYSYYMDDDRDETTPEEKLAARLTNDLKLLEKLGNAAANLRYHPIFDSPFNQLKRLKLPYYRIKEPKNDALKIKRGKTANPRLCMSRSSALMPNLKKKVMFVESECLKIRN